MKEKLKIILNKVGIYLKPFLSWKFLIAYSIPFTIINLPAGIAFILFTLGVRGVLITVGMAGFALLWGPTPEKLITIPIAIGIHTKLFKNDPKTREALQVMYTEAQADGTKLKDLFRRKR